MKSSAVPSADETNSSYLRIPRSYSSLQEHSFSFLRHISQQNSFLRIFPLDISKCMLDFISMDSYCLPYRIYQQLFLSFKSCFLLMFKTSRTPCLGLQLSVCFCNVLYICREILCISTINCYISLNNKDELIDYSYHEIIILRLKLSKFLKAIGIYTISL